MSIEYRGIEYIWIVVQTGNRNVCILHIPLETCILSIGLGNEGHLMRLLHLLFQRYSLLHFWLFLFLEHAFKFVGSSILPIPFIPHIPKDRHIRMLVIAVHLGAGRYGKRLREGFTLYSFPLL